MKALRHWFDANSYNSKMTESRVKLDNALYFKSHIKSFLESYLLHIHDISFKKSFITQYQVVSPSDPDMPAYGLLCAHYFSSETGIISGHQKFDLEQHDIMHADSFISFDKSTLSLSECNGEVRSPSQINWQISLDDPALQLKLMPYEWLYQSSWIKSKWLTPRFSSPCHGKIFANEHVIPFKDFNVYQAHSLDFLGSKDLSPRTWIRIPSFDNDAQAFAEIIITPAQYKNHHSVFCFALVGTENGLYASNTFPYVLLNRILWQNNCLTLTLTTAHARLICTFDINLAHKVFDESLIQSTSQQLYTHVRASIEILPHKVIGNPRAHQILTSSQALMRTTTHVDLV